MGTPLALSPLEIARVLLSTKEMLLAHVQALTPDVAGWHPAPGEWCVHQIMGHLIETESRGFAERIRRLSVEVEPIFVSLDQEQEAIERNDCEREIATLIEEFCAIRDASCVLVRGFAPESMQLYGWHPDAGKLSASDLLNEWVYHDMDHLRQIMANVQQYVWSHLGATQEWYQATGA